MYSDRIPAKSWPNQYLITNQQSYEYLRLGNQIILNLIRLVSKWRGSQPLNLESVETVRPSPTLRASDLLFNTPVPTTHQKEDVSGGTPMLKIIFMILTSD